MNEWEIRKCDEKKRRREREREKKNGDTYRAFEGHDISVFD